MKKIAVYLGVLLVLVLGYTVVLSLMNPVRPGSVPGTVKAGYDRWYDMGQRVESSGMVLSVQSVREDAELARQAALPQGSTLLLVDVTIENVRAEQTLFYSPFFAILFNAQAPGMYRAELVDTEGKELHSGHLPPGGQVRGSIAFQVPTGARPSRFRYGEGIYVNSSGFPNWAPIQIRLQ